MKPKLTHHAFYQALHFFLVLVFASCLLSDGRKIEYENNRSASPHFMRAASGLEQERGFKCQQPKQIH